MSVKTLRNRNSSGTIQTLNLASATASDRRFDVTQGAKGADKAGLRFLGFSWVKSTSQAVTVTVSKIDTANSNKDYVLEGPINDGGATTGTWRPDEEEMAGYDPESPDTSGWTYRIQFSQAGGACAADVVATFKEV